jgi:tRNA threonylcarbamoyl adenosine modification protein YjeE
MLVTSPSYLLDNKYDTEDGTPIHHMDLYRLPNNCNLSFLSIPQVFSNSICLIEWPERLGKYIPDAYIDVNLTINADETRNMTLSFVGEWNNSANQDLFQRRTYVLDILRKKAEISG